VKLLLTLLTGLFFLVGSLLNKIIKNNNISVLSISLAFIVILNLLLFDIGPEIFESFSIYNLLIVIIGLIILKILDLYIPNHSHHHDEKNDNKKEHYNHLKHISIITIIALTIHNIIENIALYNISNNLKAGILMCIGIGLHNVPLGLQIGGSLESKKVSLSILTLSGFVGGLIGLLIGSISPFFENLILCLTFGMLLYLILFEFLKEIWSSRKNIYTYYGIIIGVILIIITNLI
jgi:zinc transporter ZupT